MSRRIYSIGVGMAPSTSKLGSYVRARRLILGFSQAKLAEKLGWKSNNTVSLLEIGRHQLRLTGTQLAHLAQTLRCNLGELARLYVPIGVEPKTELGRLIRTHRTRLDLSYKQLATRLGIGTETLHNWETGTRNTVKGVHRIRRLETVVGLKYGTLNQFLYHSHGREEKPSTDIFGQTVRKRRKELGLNQSDLARRVSTSRQYISQIEHGLNPLCQANQFIHRLAVGLDMDPEELRALRQVKRKTYTLRNRPTALGRFLTKRRQLLGLTQVDLADKANIPKSVYYLIECGKSRRWERYLPKLETALKCRIPLGVRGTYTAS